MQLAELMSRKSFSPLRVALIVETSASYGRGLLQGILRYMRLHNEWSVFLEQRDLQAKPPSWLATWDGDGILSRATTPQLADAVIATGVPLVELTDRGCDYGFVSVRSNDRAIGRAAASHLLERGFQRFGFCGFTEEAWSDRRQAGFVEQLATAGFDCQIYRSPWHGATLRPWEDEKQRLALWLKQQERPLGIMACNDMRAQHVLNACAGQQLSVPEEVAVVGVDNDDLLCQMCSPPLSSVIPNAEGVGYCGAELLDALMRGETVERDHLIEPLGIATRQSTDVVAIDDPEVAAALSFIRENACRGITVADVTRNVPVSRSTLERQLRKYLGRTPQQEIRYVQIKRIRELLATSDFTAERIATMCGFEHPEYMHVVFKRQMGMTPGDYRRTAKPS